MHQSLVPVRPGPSWCGRRDWLRLGVGRPWGRWFATAVIGAGATGPFLVWPTGLVALGRGPPLGPVVCDHCRPSCPLRPPFARNVRFLPTAGGAQGRDSGPANCRPSCPLRPPFARNVRFLPTAGGAQGRDSGPASRERCPGCGRHGGGGGDRERGGRHYLVLAVNAWSRERCPGCGRHGGGGGDRERGGRHYLVLAVNAWTLLSSA